ncbi:hypothetical protein BGX20_001545, partial [Mortierella sp. AD010]
LPTLRRFHSKVPSRLSRRKTLPRALDHRQLKLRLSHWRLQKLPVVLQQMKRMYQPRLPLSRHLEHL